MPRMTISPSAARKHALAWRIAAVALAAAAGALWAFQTPLGSADVEVGQGAAPPVVTPEQPAPAPITLASLDPEAARAVQERLDHAYDRPPRPAPKDPEVPENHVAAVSALRYLGAITTPKTRCAVVSIDARQHVIREGRAFRYTDPSGGEVEFTVVTVRPDAIIIDDGAGLREIKKENRSGPAVAWVSPGMNLSPEEMDRRAQLEQARINRAAATAAIQPGVVTPGMSPEQQAILRERGVSPTQAAQARDRLDQLRARSRSRGTDRTTIVDPAGNTSTRDSDAKDSGSDAPELNR